MKLAAQAALYLTDKALLAEEHENKCIRISVLRPENGLHPILIISMLFSKP